VIGAALEVGVRSEVQMELPSMCSFSEVLLCRAFDSKAACLFFDLLRDLAPVITKRPPEHFIINKLPERRNKTHKGQPENHRHKFHLEYNKSNAFNHEDKLEGCIALARGLLGNPVIHDAIE
jgi:hypothetical protein